MTKPQFDIAALRNSAPNAEWITNSSALRAYECDSYSAYRELPVAVVLPSTTDEVAAIMRHCDVYDIDVVARGAGTSLVGGAMPKAGGIVLGLARLNQVVEFNPDDRMICVQTGMTNLMVSHIAAEHNLFYAPDPSSQMACSIGGNIAMNSGGAHCLKYGVTTNNLIAVKIVSAQGEVHDFHVDDGFDLRGIICGSEGQLGVVTEAWLKLETSPEGALPMMIGFPTPEDAGECVASIIRAGIIPVAIEYMDEIMIREVERFANAGYPLVSALLIVEIEGDPTRIAVEMGAIEKIAQKHKANPIRRSQNANEATKIWAGRKAAFGVMGRLADYITLDGVVPISQLAEALRRISEISSNHGMGVTNVFHAGDGNLHPLIMYDAQKDGDLERAEALGVEILTACIELGGCLTGEHGVGIEKREIMKRQYLPHELELQMQIKDIFDPQWRLNPDKVFPLDISAERRS